MMWRINSGSRLIGNALAVLCLLAPAFTALAVHAHEEFSAHHDLAHHAGACSEAAYPHSHEAHDEHSHADAGSHAHGAVKHTHSSDAKVNHDHHRHKVQGPSADVAVFRVSGQSWSLPLLGIETGDIDTSPARSRWQDGACNGVDPLSPRGHLTILHCSLLI